MLELERPRAERFLDPRRLAAEELGPGRVVISEKNRRGQNVGLADRGGADPLLKRLLRQGLVSDPVKIWSGTSENGTPPSSVTSQVSCM